MPIHNEVQMKLLTATIGLIAFSSLGHADGRPGTREVLLDNQFVEVVRLTYPVGSESGMHTHEHPNRVAYFVKGGKVELIPGDKQEPHRVVEVADGKSLFLPATTHNVKNIGDTEIVIIETEIK